MNNGHSIPVLNVFMERCQNAYNAWKVHLSLFDNNPRSVDLWKSPLRNGLYYLSCITQEYLLLQISKLDDPAEVKGDKCLTIDYMVKFGTWDAPTLQKIQGLQAKLKGLAQQLKGARNKLICHNDLKTILEKKQQGQFPSGADVEYFKGLKEFLDIVCEDDMKFLEDEAENAKMIAASLSLTLNDRNFIR